MNTLSYAAQIAKSAYGKSPQQAEKEFNELRRLIKDGDEEAREYLSLLQGGKSSEGGLSQALSKYYPEMRPARDTSYRGRAQQALSEMMGGGRPPETNAEAQLKTLLENKPIGGWGTDRVIRWQNEVDKIKSQIASGA